MRTEPIIAAIATVLLSTLLVLGVNAPSQAGDLGVRLENTGDGMIRVEWNPAKGPGNDYVVQIATDRLIKAHVEEFPVPHGQTWLKVPHADLVTPASGDYTFVKVRIHRHGNGTDSGTPTAWIKPKVVAPPASGSRLKVATFNVRIWGVHDKKGKKKTSTSWRVRRNKITSVIRTAAPDVLLLQETSGSAEWKIAGKLMQFQDLAKRLPKKYKLATDGLYTLRRKAVGSQGSRIIYNKQKFLVLNTGYLKPPGTVPSQIRWVPWALLRDRRTGEQFYVASAHFASGADRAGSRTLYDVRQRQVNYLHTQLSKLRRSGRGIYLGGDFNSTSNTRPDNNVHRRLVTGGWYDSFATNSVKGDAYPTTNAFAFPVKPGVFRRDYIMTLDVPQGSYSYQNHIYSSLSKFQSDHFMQSAVLPVTRGPYPASVRIGRSKYKRHPADRRR